MTNNYLFVYGTLRQNSPHAMSQFLAHYANFVGNAVYQGKLYQIDYYPGVIPSDNVHDSVQGEVYKLTDVDTVLLKLDEYEECGHNFPSPTEYIRCEQYVTLKTGERIAAWIYLFNRPTTGLQYIESGDFYNPLSHN
jgi:gamma-glutamylcyclotransferase (GGCT)/AIG2-like uncharacterized protein YtfP